MLFAFWAATPGQAVVEFAIVLLLVSLVMLYTLYRIDQALVQAAVPAGYVLR